MRNHVMKILLEKSNLSSLVISICCRRRGYKKKVVDFIHFSNFSKHSY